MSTMLTLLHLGFSTRASAQTVSVSKATSSQTTTNKITISPTTVTIDPKDQSAEITFHNESTDTIDSEIQIASKPPFQSTSAGSNAKSKQKSQSGLLKLLIDESKSQDTSTSDSVLSLAPWVKGVPSRIKLAPGDTQTVRLSLEVPDTATSGEYICWIIATSNTDNIIGAPRSPFSFTIRGSDGQPRKSFSYTKLSFTIQTP